MDDYYDYDLPTATSYHDDLLDLLDHRCQKGPDREAHQDFLEQSFAYLDSAEDIHEAWQEILPTLRRQSIDTEDAIIWERLWEEDRHSTVEERPRDSLLSVEDFADTAQFGAGGGGYNDSSCLLFPTESLSYHLQSHTPPANLFSSPAYSSSLTMVRGQDVPGSLRIINPEDPKAGEDFDLPASERPGLRPRDFDFIPQTLLPQDPPGGPFPTTRAEDIAVTPGNWEVPYTVTKSNADHWDIPSPIMQPGSPSQLFRKPSLKKFCKGPQRREFVEECVATRSVVNTVEPVLDTPLPPPQDVEFRRRAVNLMNHPSDSDISVLSLGSPTAAMMTPEHSPSFEQSILNNFPPPSRTARQSCKGNRKRFNRRLESVRGPVVLSVDAPLGNDTSWSEPCSPRSKDSGRSSPGGVFALDEELTPSAFGGS